MNVVFIHLILSQFKVSAITELLNYREAKLINIYLKKKTLLKSTYFFVSNITKKETMGQGFPKKMNPTERNFINFIYLYSSVIAQTALNLHLP